MTSPINDPPGICNYALARIGSELRVGSLYDGTTVAKKCLDIYAEARDALLADGEWDFCERTVAGVLLKQAPASYLQTPWTSAYPSLPWLFEYAFPIDAIKIRGVKKPPLFLPNVDPRYNRFSIDNDSGPQTVSGYSPPLKVVLCNVPNAILIYTAQVTSPDQWNPAFLEALASKISGPLAALLSGSPDAVKLTMAQEQADAAQAAVTRS